MNNDRGMEGMAPPPSSTNGTTATHMTFFWGNNAEILFSGWPGGSTRASGGMYALALVLVFVLAFVVEWLSHSRLIKPVVGSSDVLAGLVQTFLHAIRVGLAYLVMIAVMSFNGGVFLVAVAAHILGFLLSGSRVFKKNTDMLSYRKLSAPK